MQDSRGAQFHEEYICKFASSVVQYDSSWSEVIWFPLLLPFHCIRWEVSSSFWERFKPHKSISNSKEEIYYCQPTNQLLKGILSTIPSFITQHTSAFRAEMEREMKGE